MKNLVRVLSSIILIVLLSGNVCFADEDSERQIALDRAWNSMSEEDQYDADIEYQANAVGLDVESFSLFARVVQAECDGTTDYNDGKLYVASCIWCRVYSSSWPNTVRGVLTQSGQFTTVSGGSCYASLTKASRWAVIKGKEAVLKGDIPYNMCWFNCIGYNHSAYMKVRDNYFSTTGAAVYYDNAFEFKTEDGIEIREIKVPIKNEYYDYDPGDR